MKLVSTASAVAEEETTRQVTHVHAAGVRIWGYIGRRLDMELSDGWCGYTYT